jgi:ribonuclease HI
VKFTAWRALFNCASAAEAEAHACVEGLRLASQWCHHPIILESDCARVTQALLSMRPDRSELGFIIAEGKELSQLLLELKIVKVKRDCNKVAHELAALARRNTHSAVWLGQAPACAIDLINACLVNKALSLPAKKKDQGPAWIGAMLKFWLAKY